MESNFFRRLAAELGPALVGARVDKVYRPAEAAWTFRLSLPGECRHLLFRHGREAPCLFLCAERPDNPENPDGRSMWLRKHASNRRLTSWSADWPGRRLAWGLSGEGGGFLVLDLREGPQVVPALDSAFGAEPGWPDLGAVLADPEIWRSHPHVSPPLRRALSALADLGRDRAQALYDQVRAGDSAGIWVCLPAAGPGEALVWPRPADASRGEEARVVGSALEAAALVGQAEVFGVVRREGARGETEAAKARRRRLKNALVKLAAEERRMADLASGRDKGLAVRAALARHKSSERLPRVAGMGPDGRDMEVELDGRQTLAENMERFFRLAAKGERGLAHAAARRAELSAELGDLEQGRWSPRAEALPRPRAKRVEAARDKDFTRFVSSDGLTLLRGKNAKANARLLREAAAPFDLWFHAEGGPGAHVLLKRDHAGQEPPQQSLLEAAALAALKSWQSGEARGRVMCALARDVKPLKGAAPGTVRVDKVFVSLTPDLDQGLEERLAVKQASIQGSRPLDGGWKKG